MAQPLLQRAHRRACGRHTGAERPSQVVEADLAHPGAVSSSSKALTELGPVEDRTKLRVGEDQVVVAREARPLEVAVEFGGEHVGERHGAAGAARFRCREFAAGVVSTDADDARRPVDVAPAQCEEFAA